MQELLMERLGCNKQQASIIAADLELLDPQLRGMLDAWIKEQPFDEEQQFDGYSIASLKREFGMTFTGAILTLDWLLKSPEEARAALSEKAL